jgi:hypothetical protein
MKTLFLQIILALVVFALGFEAGTHHAATSALKAEVKAEHVVAQQNATSAAKAQDASVKVEAKTAAVAAAVDTNKAQIKKRVTAQIQRQAAVTPTENHPDETNPEASPARDGCGFSLDVGTVRMLNASRQGTAFDPARGGNEASDAAPALCFTDFIDADQDLTKLYLDLSERHNALVDSVEQFQSEQRSRLGIKEQKD